MLISLPLKSSKFLHSWTKYALQIFVISFISACTVLTKFLSKLFIFLKKNSYYDIELSRILF